MEDRNLCIRCGMPWDADKRKRNEVLCVSCRARPAKSIKYGSDRCIPWQGAFTEDDEPVLNGELFLPGIRLCNHSDCCNVLHVKTVVEFILDNNQES